MPCDGSITSDQLPEQVNEPPWGKLLRVCRLGWAENSTSTKEKGLAGTSHMMRLHQQPISDPPGCANHHTQPMLCGEDL